MGSVESLSSLVDANDSKLTREIIAKLQVHPDGNAQQVIRRLAKSQQLPTKTNALAVGALQPNSEENIATLIELSGHETAQIANEALRSIRGYIPKPQELLKLKENAVTAEAKELFEKLSSSLVIPEDWKNRSVQEWISVLPQGNPERGERVFYNGQAGGCFRCHQVQGRGSEVGPDLSRIGDTLALDKLLESVIEPSRNIAPRFQSWKIVLKDGRLITGMQVGEDREGNQFYVDSTGAQHSVSPAEIEVKQADTVSIMPQNLLENLTSQELADLITYLSTLKGIN